MNKSDQDIRNELIAKARQVEKTAHIQKIKPPRVDTDIKEELLRIEYFKNNMPVQSETIDFKMSHMQNLPLNKEILAKKGAYALLDARPFKSRGVKYDPDDVWSWDPLKDKKVGAQRDNELWVAEKNAQLAQLREWLKKSGSASSAFIAAKDKATRHLQVFRINLPSQRQNRIHEPENIIKEKPKRTPEEIERNKISKHWQKLSLNDLRNDAKRLGYYTKEMANMKAPAIRTLMLKQFDEEAKVDIVTLIKRIGQIKSDEDDKNVKELTLKFKDQIDYGYALQKMIDLKLIVITPDVLELIINPNTLFKNYARYDIAFRSTTYTEKAGTTESKEAVTYSLTSISNLEYNKVGISELGYLKSNEFDKLRKENEELRKERAKLINSNDDDDIERFKEVTDRLHAINLLIQTKTSLSESVSPTTRAKIVKIQKKLDDYREGKANLSDILDPSILKNIYEILRNMEYTSQLAFNSNITPYVNDISKLAQKDIKTQVDIMFKYPILEIIKILYEKNMKITLWNILSTVIDTWYPEVIVPAMINQNPVADPNRPGFILPPSKEQLEEIQKQLAAKRKQKLKKFSSIEITVMDVVSYLGDSYMQNLEYSEGFKETDEVTTALNPGCKYERYDPDSVSFDNENSGKHNDNPYITVFKNPHIDDVNLSILIVGNDLHRKEDVSNNLARRAALFYNVDLNKVSPCFGSNELYTSGKNRVFAIQLVDVLKYLEKGGWPYTISELTDPELKFREKNNLIDKKLLKNSNKDREDYIKLHKTALKSFFRSKDKTETLEDLTRGKTHFAGKARPSQFAETRFGAGFDEAELGFRQLHFAADLFGGLFVEIETDQYLAVAPGDAVEDAQSDLEVLSADGQALGIGRMIAQHDAIFQAGLASPRMHVGIDAGRHLAANHSAHVSHQTFGLAQFSALNGLGDGQEDVVHPVVEILRAQLPAEIEADAFGKQAIQLFECSRFAGADAFHQRRPGMLRDLVYRSAVRHVAEGMVIDGKGRSFTHFPP